jgi:hypothetical protein
VIDNIDRLESEESVKAWTTLRAFFDNETKDWEWKNRFWLIAPFDENHVQVGPITQEHNHKGNKIYDKQNRNSSSELKAFLDKTFQIKFHVPKPILSNWKSYFMESIKEAFVGIEVDVAERVASIYQSESTGLNNSHPTPRDIKQFINSVSGRYRIWKGKIGLPLLSYYEALEQSGAFNLEDLKKGEFSKRSAASYLDESKIDQKLAAIYYGCSVIKEANQLLFQNEVNEALHTGNSKKIIDYLDSPGFFDVLAECIRPKLEKAIILNLVNSALVLQEIQTQKNKSFHDNFSRLRKLLLDLDAVNTYHENIGDGLVTIWEENGQDQKLTMHILTILSKSNLEDEQMNLSQWWEVANPILSELLSVKKESEISSHLIVPGGAHSFLELMNIVPEGSEIISYLNPNTDKTTLISTFKKQVSLTPKDTIENLGSIFYLLVKHGLLTIYNDYSGLLQQIESQLKFGREIESSKLVDGLTIVHTLYYLLDVGAAKDLLNKAEFKDAMLYYLNLFENDTEAKSILFLTIILFNSDCHHHNSNNRVGNAKGIFNSLRSVPENKDFRFYIINHVITFNLLENIIDVTQNHKNLSKFRDFIIRRYVSTTIDFEYKLYIDHFIVFNLALSSKELNSITKGYLNSNESSEIIEYVLDKYSDIHDVSDIHIHFFSKCSKNQQKVYFEKLKSLYQNLDSDNWKTILQEDDSALRLLIEITKNGFNLELGPEFKQAIKEYNDKLIKGKVNPPAEDIAEDWELLVQSLKNTSLTSFKTVLSEQLRETFSDNDQAIIFLNLYHDTLISENIYRNLGQELIHLLFEDLVRSGEKEKIDWVSKIIQPNPEILKENKESAESFKELVDSEIEKAADETIKAQLVSLSEIIG